MNWHPASAKQSIRPIDGTCAAGAESCVEVMVAVVTQLTPVRVRFAQHGPYRLRRIPERRQAGSHG
jgi:hypothetical protein